MPLPTNTKTLYTPVFFSSSEPPRSATSANFKVPSAYLNSLSRTHIALAQIVQEVPSSRPGSPTEDADGSYPDSFTHERVSALRARVQEAWTKTDGDPSDGKWTALTHLLRIGVTSGKAGRWAGTRADLKAADAPDGGWINAATESEWAEWEKRVNVKNKVENWKMRLETQEELVSQSIKDTPNASKSDHQEEEAKTSDREQVRANASVPALSTAKVANSTLKLTSESVVITNTDPLKDKSLFGFAVVKRSNATAAAVGKKPHINPKQANQQLKDAPPADSAQPIHKIVDVPETSFLPPSFPYSQIITSTPNAKPISSDKLKHKPEPIPFTASPLGSPVSSSSSPHITKVHGRQVKSSSLPAIPSTLPLPPVPTTPPRNFDDNINDNNKRKLYSPDRTVKKARTMPSLGSSPVIAGFSPLPTTPKKQNLPTLTELLASAKKGKKSLKGLKSKSAEEEPVSNFRFPSPLPAFEDNPYMLDPYAISVDHSALDLDISPSKSLSSLAGSDSEDEDDDQAPALNFSPSSFNPYATSTQHQNYPHEGRGSPFLREKGKALSLGFGGYNSQFDVAGQVDKVDKLLEKDVDYEGWLRDPSLEREGIGAEESP